jgi:AcrR family transcriptional regulator
MLPQIAAMLDDAAEGAAAQLRNLARAAQQPHLLDDATLDRMERVYGEQRDFLPVYDRQLARWREGKLTVAQECEIARLEQVLAALRPQLDEILTRAQALRSGTIDAIQRMSDEELGLRTLLGAGSLREAEDLLRAASGGGASGRVGRGKPKPGTAPTGSPAQGRPPASSSGKGRAAPAPRPACSPPGAPFALPPEVTAAREQRGGATISTFTHTALGQLGRVIVQQVAPHQTQFSAEVSGRPADPMTEERKRLFNPIAEAIAAALDHLPPVADPAPLQPTLVGEEATIPSQLFERPRCGAPAGLLLS